MPRVAFWRTGLVEGQPRDIVLDDHHGCLSADCVFPQGLFGAFFEVNPLKGQRRHIGNAKAFFAEELRRVILIARKTFVLARVDFDDVFSIGRQETQRRTALKLFLESIFLAAGPDVVGLRQAGEMPFERRDERSKPVLTENQRA